MFETIILPVVIRFAAVCFKCPDLQSMAVTQAWWAWSTASPEQRELPPSVWARAGVRRVKAKRDLPGVGTSTTDALHHSVQGGAMTNVMDRFPGPEQIVTDREWYATVKSRANDRERNLIDLFEAGTPAKEVAAKLGVSAGRVTQIRQGLNRE